MKLTKAKHLTILKANIKFFEGVLARASQDKDSTTLPIWEKALAAAQRRLVEAREEYAEET